MESNKISRTFARLHSLFPHFKYLGLLALLMLAIMLLVGPSSLPISAASFTVSTASFTTNSTSDTVDTNPGDGACSDIDLECSLRAAIMEANALGGVHTITLPAGTYTLDITGTGENASATGDLDITSDITLTGAGSGSTFIDGNDADRVLDVRCGTVVLSGLTLRNGLTPFAEGGGGLFVLDGADVTAANVVIQSNAVTGGEGTPAGGIFVDGILTLNNSQVLSNTAQYGGGIYNVGTLNIDQTTIQGNADDAAYLGAGGILNNGGDITVTRSAIIANTNGGFTHRSGTSLVENVTISGNTDFGLMTGASGLTVTHSTIANNGASGITLDGGIPALENTIVYGHAFDCSGSITSNGHNLDGDGTCGLAATGDLSSSNPSLGSLADNDGATKTHALLAWSAAHNAGDPSFSSPPLTDQRGPGFPRVLIGRIDIGAYEADPAQDGYFTVNTTDDVDDGACTLGHCSLREALTAITPESVIDFNISGPGPHTIQPTSALPPLGSTMSIFPGSDEGGSEAIVLDGSLAGEGVPGITLAGNESGISELEISNFDGPGVLITGDYGNGVYHASIHDNGGLGIDLGGDGVTPNDFGDGDTGPNGLLNMPVLQRVINDSGNTLVQGFIIGQPGTTVDIDLYANTTCDSSYFGEGETYVDTISPVNLNADGYATFQHTLPAALPSGTGVSATTIDASFSTSEFSRCIIAGANNDSWPNAFEIPLSSVGVAGDTLQGTADGYISQPSQSRWFRFPVAPNSTVIVDLTNLPANYDLVLFRDIAQTYEELTAPADLDELTELNAEFAPDMYAPDMYAPDMYAPDMYAPDMYAPDMYAPDMYAPDMYAPDMYAPDMYAPDMYAPDMYAPDMYAPDMYAPDMYAPDMYAPDMYASEFFTEGMNDPDQRYFASAQVRSTVAVSGRDGTSDETVVAGSWSESGDFYVRVRGRNGIFDPTSPFNLNVTVLGDECVALSDFEFTPDTSGVPSGSIANLILVDYARMAAIYPDLVAMQTALNTLATQTNGQIVDVSQFAAINAANSQADANPQCVFTKNLVAYGIKDIVDAYRIGNPIENVVVVGNDDIVPFFRYPDQALLANENNYVPPVQELTASQASLRLGYVLSQDTYGASVEVDRRNSSLPVPELPVGRLVEDPGEIMATIDAFLAANGVVTNPAGAFKALVTGYDFLDDGAVAVRDQLTLGLDLGDGVDPVDSLISPATLSPSESWSADQLRSALLDSGRHDLVYLAGHFSAASTLAADYETRMFASEILTSGVDMSNSIIFSAGCHSGYNIVNEHGVPSVTIDPDWAQAFAQKGALLIAGTGYQYGDTDFVEYSERLYREFAKELRAGSGPVSAGQALVRAKQNYLAGTAQMRPIHEKVLLQSTIFGLPMLTIDMPAGRGDLPGETSIVPLPLSDTGSNPGLTLGLQYADITVNPPTTYLTKTLESVADESNIITTYYEGEDGLVINPAEPIMPLDQFNISVSGAFTPTVLRGAGFRGGSYADQPDIIPLTSAATTELRGIHTPFITPVYYPIVPWEVNYFDALAKTVAEGEMRLSVIPAQYRSSASDAISGTLRIFDEISFRLYYNNNTTTYDTAVAGVTNTPALASPPLINSVLAQEEGTDVDFSVEVTGDPSAGIQEVWVTYTALSGPYAGLWQSLDLVQNTDQSTLWAAQLPLNGTPAGDMRFIAQAVNGVGLVSLSTNKGAYYVPDINPGDPPTPPGDLTPAPAVPTSITLAGSNPANGEYGTEITVSAQLLDGGGAPLAGKTVEFGLTTQRITAQTSANGTATVNLTLISVPVIDTLRVSFDGDTTYAAASDSASFDILPIATNLTLETPTPTFNAGGSVDLAIALTDDTGRPLREKSVLVLIEDGGTLVYAETVITNLLGNAVLLTAPLTSGSYDVTAHFGSAVAVNGSVVNLTNPRYLASSTDLLLIANTPPVAAAGGPYAVDEGSTVQLDAGASSDVDSGQALTYLWDLDDNGSFETEGITPTFSAAALDGPASRAVTLQVCDPLDDCDETSVNITIVNVLPEIQEVGNLGPVAPGDPVTISVIASDVVDALTYAFDCDNDNNFEIAPQTGNSAQCTFTAEGAFTVNAQVDDGDGGMATGSTTVQVIGDSSEPMIYLTIRTKGAIAGINFSPEDILLYDGDAASWEIYFDASDVGLSKNNLHAFALLDDGSLLMSFTKSRDMGDVGLVQPHDVVRFVPTSIGANTAGTFEMYLDGSDVGLTSSGEWIDALALAPDGRLVISTIGKSEVPGMPGSVRANDEDLLVLNGNAGGGTWEIYFYGSDVGLTEGSEDIWGLGINPGNGEIYLNTQSDFLVDGVTGSARDILACAPTQLGPTTECAYRLLWDGVGHGLGDYKIDGIHVEPGN